MMYGACCLSRRCWNAPLLPTCNWVFIHGIESVPLHPLRVCFQLKCFTVADAAFCTSLLAPTCIETDAIHACAPANENAQEQQEMYLQGACTQIKKLAAFRLQMATRARQHYLCHNTTLAPRHAAGTLSQRRSSAATTPPQRAAALHPPQQPDTS